ncbi:MAG: ClbS/DfsB family four-helix bundle protein [Pyrinomonadaceae bacterium]|nr:ClbS/DfsB family four-helix bundle protein [Pyrinomonadaceae bacterium]
MSSVLHRTGLVRELEAERTRWETLLAQVGQARLTEPILPGGWSFKDLIAHLTAWQRQSVARLEAALRDQTPPPPEWGNAWDEEADLEAINDWIFQQNRDRPLDQVLAEWRHIFQRVIDLTRALPEDRLYDPTRFEWMEGEPLIMIPANSFGHYHDEHLGPTLEWLSSRGIQHDGNSEGDRDE